MMKKIVPFKKEIDFNTNVSEITSISLEHNLHIQENNIIGGNLMISGEYKITDTSINTEIFNFELPFDITVDDKYLLDNVTVDIDDFYYELINNKSLEVNIDVSIDKLIEKPLIEKEENVDEVNEDTNEEEDDKIMERCIEREDILSQIETDEDSHNIEDDDFFLNLGQNTVVETDTMETKSVEKINSLFDNLDSSSETYKTYKVCIIRNGDTVESILQKYSITKEQLENYNNLSDIKIGDKLIIPALQNEKV